MPTFLIRGRQADYYEVLHRVQTLGRDDHTGAPTFTRDDVRDLIDTAEIPTGDQARATLASFDITVHPR